MLILELGQGIHNMSQKHLTVTGKKGFKLKKGGGQGGGGMSKRHNTGANLKDLPKAKTRTL